MKNYYIYLLRHGATAANEDGRYIGSTDLPLSEKGRAELQKLKDTQDYPAAQRVYTSPLKRCQETAEVLYPNTQLSTIDALREYDFGEFENRTIASLQSDPDFLDWVSGGMKTPPKGAESRETFTLRYEKGFLQILQEMMKDNITRAAVVTHSGIITGWLSAHGVPQKDNPMEWATESGHGYVIAVNMRMWTAGDAFEVMGTIPYAGEEE